MNAAPSYISDALFNVPFPNLSMIDVSYDNGELLYSIKNVGPGSAPPGIVVHIFELKNDAFGIGWQIFRFPENTTGYLWEADSWVNSTQSHMPLIDADMDIQHHPDTPSLYIGRSWMIKHSTPVFNSPLDVHKGKLTFDPPLQGGTYMIVVNLPPFIKTIFGQLHDWEFVQEENVYLKFKTKDYDITRPKALQGMLDDDFDPDATNNALTFIVPTAPTAPIGWYSPALDTTTKGSTTTAGLANIWYIRSLHKFVYSSALMYASKNNPDGSALLDETTPPTSSSPWNIKRLRFDLVSNPSSKNRKDYQIAMKNIDSMPTGGTIDGNSDWEVVKTLGNFKPTIGWFIIELDNGGFEWTGGDLAFSFGWGGDNSGYDQTGVTYYFTSDQAKAWYIWTDANPSTAYTYSTPIVSGAAMPPNHNGKQTQTTNIPLVEFEFEE